MRSQRGEKELGLFLLPYRFLWVPPTSWLQPEANYPGNMQAQLPACGRRKQGRAAEHPCGRCMPWAVSAEPGSVETLGKEAEEWPAWVFILLGRKELYWEEEKAFSHSCPCFPLE